MALNPNIALEAGRGIPQFDLQKSIGGALNVADLMQKLQYQPQLLEQKLATDRASQLNLEASTAGQEMLNQQTARENATRLRMAEIAKQNTSIDPKTKKLTLDHLNIGNTAAAEGMDPGIVFSYLDKAAKNAQENLKTESDKADFASKVLGAANNVLRVQTDPVQANNVAKSAMDVLTTAVGADAAKTYAGQYWQVPETPPIDANGKPDVNAIGNHFIGQAKVNSNATMTPLEKENLGISQRQIALSEQVATPAYQASISLIPGAGTRTQGLIEATGNDAIVNGINDGVSAAKNIKRFETRVGSLVGEAWNKLVEQNPDAARFQAQIDSYNRRNGTNISTRDGIDAVTQRLNQEARQLSGKATTLRNVATSPTIKEAVTASPAAAVPQPAPAAPSAPPSKYTMPRTGEIRAGADGGRYVFKGAVAPGDNPNKMKYWELVK